MRSTPRFIALKVREKNTHHSSNMILGNWTWRGSGLIYCIISPCSHTLDSCISDTRTGPFVFLGQCVRHFTSYWKGHFVTVIFTEKINGLEVVLPMMQCRDTALCEPGKPCRYKSCVPYAERNSIILRFLGGWSFFSPCSQCTPEKGKLKMDRRWFIIAGAPGKPPHYEAWNW